GIAGIREDVHEHLVQLTGRRFDRWQDAVVAMDPDPIGPAGPQQTETDLDALMNVGWPDSRLAHSRERSEIVDDPRCPLRPPGHDLEDAFHTLDGGDEFSVGVALREGAKLTQPLA